MGQMRTKVNGRTEARNGTIPRISRQCRPAAMRLTAFACFPCQSMRAWYCKSQSIGRGRRDRDNAVVNGHAH
ncbi:hypothetical protein AB7M42_001403 [Bradyrhizobium diazoefficiens]|nr:hypothetical protein [Bradyrhizobium japonicum]MBP1095925.1 hypothetical protein [Bradyrhizobium japonicum]